MATTYLLTVRRQQGYGNMQEITNCLSDCKTRNSSGIIAFKILAEPLVIAVVQEESDVHEIVNELQKIQGVEINSEILIHYDYYATDVLGLPKQTETYTGELDIGSSKLWCQHALIFDERRTSDLTDIWKKEAAFTRKLDMKMYKVVGQPKVHIFSEKYAWQWDKLAYDKDAGAALTGIVKQLNLI